MLIGELLHGGHLPSPLKKNVHLYIHEVVLRQIISVLQRPIPIITAHNLENLPPFDKQENNNNGLQDSSYRN